MALPVARVCNYFNKPYTFRADSFLGITEQVVHVLGTGRETANSCLVDSNNLDVFVQAGRSTGPESSDLRPQPVPDPMSELRSSTVKPLRQHHLLLLWRVCMIIFNV